MKSRIARADNAPDEVAARLDEAYQPWLDDLTGDQRDAIQAWQGTDRHYDQIQAAFRREDDDPTETPDEIAAEIDSLIEVITAGELPFEITTWKGIRSTRRTFGRALADLRPGTVLPYGGFFAVTVDRDIATPQFTHPPGPPAAAILKMSLPAKFPMAWIAAAGASEHRTQYELLGLPQLSLRVAEVAYLEDDGNVAEISVEVIIR